MVRDGRWLRGLVLLAGWVIAAVLAGCTLARRAPVTYVKQAWSQDGLTGRDLTTDHFEIISTVRDAEFEEALPAFVEAAYQQYEATLPAPQDAGPRLTMYVFGTRSEWARFARRHFPARFRVYARIRTGGFTEGATSVSFFVTRAATLATLAHEGWHQYVGTYFDASIPAWLNEGLACYHEAVQFTDSKPEFTPGRNSFRVNSLREALREEKLLSLPEIVRTNAGEIIGRGSAKATERYYAQVWALVSFLRRGAGGRYAKDFDRMLRDIVDGTFRVRASAARLATRNATENGLGAAVIRAYFGQEPDDLADAYYDHLIRLTGF